MKNHTITVKLSDSEYKKLKHNVDNENMTISQYIRERINNIEPRNSKELQSIATKLCEIYIELSKKNLNENDDIMVGIHRLCQILY